MYLVAGITSVVRFTRTARVFVFYFRNIMVITREIKKSKKLNYNLYLQKR